MFETFHSVAPQSAAVFALRQKLAEFAYQRELRRKEEEATLRQLFEDAGGNLKLLGDSVSLSERAMTGLIRGSEGERNLTAFRQRAFC